MFLRICQSNQAKRRLPKTSRRVSLSSRCRAYAVLAVGISLVSWFGYRQIKTQLTEPQAFLVLGGAKEREKFTAKLARQHPQLEIWISGGSNPEYAQWVFSQAGVNLNRVHLDDRAVDTVTNFTTLVDDLQSRGIDSIYLVTSDYHMRRAMVIGEIILGSRGITFKTMPVPSQQEPEPLEKAIRDGARALLWVTTGHTGSSLSQVFQSQKPPSK